MTIPALAATAVTTAGPDHRLRELFAALDRREARALDEVWRLCGDDMFGLALWRTGRRCDAEDAVQDALVRVARSAGRLHRVRRPRAWLLTVLHRAALDVVARRPRGQGPVEDAADLVAEQDPDRAADARRVSALLARLPAAQRETVYLRHYLELSFREIGSVTGVPTFTAASRYRLGLRRLRRLLGVA